MPIPKLAEAAPGRLVPVAHRVAWRRVDTVDTVTLGIEPVRGQVQQSRSGQFNMLGAFAVGEIPVSVSGGGGGAAIEHTIRDVGAVSHALCSLSEGEMLGVRGPFGQGWDTATGEGRDLLVMAGGIGLAPLRPAILEALGGRERFRRLTILVGARTPSDVLFENDLRAWRGQFDVELRITVDRAEPGWLGEVGVVTRELRRIDIDGPRTLALLCGPEVMIRLSALALQEAGVPSAGIRVSLERNMQCGFGQCGHCQLGPLFVCSDGPVVTWEQAAPLLAVAEL